VSARASAPEVESTDVARRPSRVRWVVLALLCLVSFIAYVLRTNMSIAGEAMMKDLGFSELQFGMVLAAFAWGYGLFQLPGGLFGEKVGGRLSMALIVFAWGILTLFTGLVPGPSVVPLVAGLCLLVTLRFLMGAAQAPLYPITSGVAIAAWFPVAAWGLVNSIPTTALNLGAAAAGPGVAWLTEHVGWRNSFVVTAPLGILAAIVWWWFYRDDPAEHPSVNAGEVDLIRVGRTPAGTGVRASWRIVLTHPGLLAITGSYFCMNYVFYLFFNWFFYYLVDIRGLPHQVGGYFTGAQWMVGSVTASLGGALCDRLCARFGPRAGCRITIVGGLLVCAPLLVAGAMVADPILAVTLLSLSFGATQLTDGPFWAAAMRIGGEHAPAATGLMNTGGNVVGGIGAILVPLTARHFGWVIALSTGALFAVVGAGLWGFIRADEPMVTDRAPAG